DYDGDGKPDLLLVGVVGSGSVHLLHNSGDGKFVDVTAASGIKLSGGGLGCAAGDYDNDGKTDFAVCMLNGVHLFHNEGGGRWSDVTETVGIKRDGPCTSVTFVDYDHDGDLDLYLTGGPRGSSDLVNRNQMWRNNGNSTFTDVTAETALGVEATGVA